MAMKFLNSWLAIAILQGTEYKYCVLLLRDLTCYVIGCSLYIPMCPVLKTQSQILGMQYFLQFIVGHYESLINHILFIILADVTKYNYVTGPVKTGHVGTLFLPAFSIFLNS